MSKISAISKGNKFLISDLSETIFQGLSSGRKKSIAADQTKIIINVKDIADNRITTETIDSIPFSGFRNIDKYTVRTGDVVLACRGTQIKSAVVPEALSGAVIASNLIAIRLKAGWSPYLLSVFFQSPEGQKQLQAHAKFTTTIAFSVADIARIEVPCISAEIQERLSAMIFAANTYYESAVESARLRRDIAYNIAFDEFSKNPMNLLTEA